MDSFKDVIDDNDIISIYEEQKDKLVLTKKKTKEH